MPKALKVSSLIQKNKKRSWQSKSKRCKEFSITKKKRCQNFIRI